MPSSGSHKDIPSRDYQSDSLLYLVSLNKNCRGNTAVFTLSDTHLTMRNKLIEWLLLPATRLRASPQAVQFGICLIDEYISSNSPSQLQYQLIGIICLVMGMKLHDSVRISLSVIIAMGEWVFSKSDFISLEFSILSHFKWDIARPVAAEFIRRLLYITKIEYDFSGIIHRSDRYSMVCYQYFEFCRYSPLEIAVVSVICVLEQTKQISFRNKWMKMVEDLTGVDLKVLDQLKNELVMKLISLNKGPTATLSSLLANPISGIYLK